MTNIARRILILSLGLVLAPVALASEPVRSPDRLLEARLSRDEAPFTVGVYYDDAAAPQRGFVALWPPDTEPRGEPWWTGPLYTLWHVEAGVLEGGGAELIVLGLWSNTVRHDEPQPHRTVRVLGWNGRTLVELWRGSALGRPLRDFRLLDVDGDGTDELVALERKDEAVCALTAYRWTGFGFNERARLDGPCEHLALPPVDGSATAVCAEVGGVRHCL